MPPGMSGIYRIYITYYSNMDTYPTQVFRILIGLNADPDPVFYQRCGVENISFSSGYAELQIRIAAPAPNSFIR
jgi:hypothetical protein